MPCPLYPRKSLLTEKVTFIRPQKVKGRLVGATKVYNCNFLVSTWKLINMIVQIVSVLYRNINVKIFYFLNNRNTFGVLRK